MPPHFSAASCQHQQRQALATVAERECKSSRLLIWMVGVLLICELIYVSSIMRTSMDFTKEWKELIPVLSDLAETLLLTISLLQQRSYYIHMNSHLLLINETDLLLTIATAFPGSVSIPAVRSLVGKAVF